LFIIYTTLQPEDGPPPAVYNKQALNLSFGRSRDRSAEPQSE
jgi:hypothetical protein